jgi:Zn-dependent peptidase ImmA (M78 family)
MASFNTNFGAKRAREAREEWGIDPAAPIGCLLSIVEEREGLPVSLSRMPENVEGLCWMLDGECMLWVNAHDWVPRRRFTLAHELGHRRCRHDDSSIVIESFETLTGGITNTVEAQANAFAAELLAPAAGIRELVGDDEPTIEHVVDISARYGVSAIVAAYRFATLRLVDDDRLVAAVNAGEHKPLWEAAGHTPYEDGLSAIGPDELPRLAPKLADSSLGAMVRGEASVEDAAACIGCEAEVLAETMALLGF